MAVLLSRLGAGAHRHRLAVVLGWLVVLVAGGVGAVTLAGETTNTFAIPGQESTTALQRIDQEFGAASGGASARVVLQAPAGQTLTEPGNAATIGDLVAELDRLPGVVSATNPLDPANPAVNRDQTIAYSTVTYAGAVGEVTPEQQQALLDAVAGARSTGLTVEVTGQAVEEAVSVGGVAELLGVGVALMILAVTYGSLIAAGMNLLTAAIGVGIGILGITIATGFVELSSTTPTLAAMLGLAVGIDYTLFIVTRHRQELRRGADVGTAVSRAVGTAGAAVVTAGLTVVIALAFLFVAGIPFLTQMGLAAAGTVIVAVLIALTLVPAVLGLLGRRVLPRRQRSAPAPRDSSEESRGFFTGWIGAVTRHRLVAVLLSVVALGVIALPVTSLRTTLIQSHAEGSTLEKADRLLADGFGAGFNGPLTVLFEGANAVPAATSAGASIAGLDDVALVTPPIPNRDGSAALVSVIPRSGPTSPDTEALVGDLRDRLGNLPGATASVTGLTAVSVDVARTLDDALPVYLAIVVGLALVLLVLVFRSLLVPLIGVLGFLVTIGASFGARWRCSSGAGWAVW